jgi:hypothetical protein
MSENRTPDMNPETVSNVYFMDEFGVNHQEGHFEFIRDGGHFEMVFSAEGMGGRDSMEAFTDRLDTEGTTVLALNDYYPVGYGMLEAIDIIEDEIIARVDSERVVSASEMPEIQDEIPMLRGDGDE